MTYYVEKPSLVNVDSKRVQAIDRRQPKMNFYLERMCTIFDRAGGEADVPHRHAYYTILLIEEAEGLHVVDYEKYPFGILEVHFVRPEQVHQVALTARPKGWAMTFSKEFLMVNNIRESFISDINLFQRFGRTPPLQLEADTFKRLKGIISEMEFYLHSKLNHHTRAVGALLQLFLIYCNNSIRLDTTHTEEEHKGVCILRDFKALIDKNYKHWHKVKDYASEISISPKHLSQTVKNITGKVAKEHIQDRLLLEAKRLLLHTELSVKEIAYETGFEEPLHFSGFFKKQAGVSPSHFRNANHF